MANKKFIKNEKGFTLIEIIAVIIIMGILAAVAVPKFFSMQDDAKEAALNGALSEAAARFNHAFAKYILQEKKAPADVATDLIDATLYLGPQAANCTALTGGEDIGDFKVCWAKNGASGLIITVITADTIGETALVPLRNADPLLDKTKKVLTGITWGS